MKAHIVLKPYEADETANPIEIHAVKIVETYAKSALTDFKLPKVTSGEAEPQPKRLDARQVKEHVRVTGHIDNKTDKDALVTNVRTFNHETTGSQVDLHILSNDGVMNSGADYDQGSNNEYSTNPTIQHLVWKYTDTSGGGNIIRLRITYEDDTLEDDEGYTGRYAVDVELERGRRVGQK